MDVVNLLYSKCYHSCGKTTLCQLLSKLLNRTFYSINCHIHTEAADFLGGLRPIRNRTETEEVC